MFSENIVTVTFSLSPSSRLKYMAVLGVLAAVIVALLTAVLFVFVAYTVYLVIVHRRYAHIPQPKGAS